MRVKRLATIIQFRARTDLTQPQEMIRLGCRVTTFKGAVLGTTNDGNDVIAAFHIEGDADRFLTRYFEGEREPGIRAYVPTEFSL